MEKSFFCANEEQTKKLGFTLGLLLREGDTVCLQGQLGAGKTTFAKAVAEGMGFDRNEVTSPTFTILNVYEGQKTLQHFDLYRLDREEELRTIGFEEYFGKGAVSLVEWADLFPSLLPEGRLQIKLEVCANGRSLIFRAHGARSELLLQEVSDAHTGD